jgi:hypothetical protein
MATVLRVSKIRSAFCHLLFKGKKIPPVEINRELVTVYGAVMRVLVYVRKWCTEFDSGRVNVMDEERSGRPSTSADLVQDIDALLTKGVGVLLHDSARPNSDAPTANLLKFWGWQILPHPTYSPEFAPPDFRLFSKMKTTSVVSASN